MAFAVKIKERAAPIRVELGETVLQAALAQGVAYPCGCQAGNCGACKSRLIAGEIEMLPCSDYALSPQERAAGLILACRTLVWSDAEIASLDADPAREAVA